MSDLNDLIREVAPILAGRPCVVRWREPVWSNASGAAYKTLDGRAIIDINPGAVDVLYTLSHEAAHIRLHWQEMTPSDCWRSEPGSLKTPSETRAALKALPREGEADRLANAWKAYALENTWKHYNGANLFEKCLLALLDWKG